MVTSVEVNDTEIVRLINQSNRSSILGYGYLSGLVC